MFKMEAQIPENAHRWGVLHLTSVWYGNDPRGECSCLMPDVDYSPLLYVEVAFYQTWADVCDKICRILDEPADSLLGVLVMNPTRPSVAADFISRQDWYEGIASREGGAFSRIVINGHIWMEEVKVHVCLFEKTWKAEEGDKGILLNET